MWNHSSLETPLIDAIFSKASLAGIEDATAKAVVITFTVYSHVASMARRACVQSRPDEATIAVAEEEALPCDREGGEIRQMH